MKALALVIGVNAILILIKDKMNNRYELRRIDNSIIYARSLTIGEKSSVSYLHSLNHFLIELVRIRNCPTYIANDI